MAINKKRVTRTDHGLNRIKKEYEKLAQKPHAKVGVLADAGTYQDGTSIAMVSAWNEFGTSKIPARPHIRGGIIQSRANIKRIKKQVILGIHKGAFDTRRGLDIIGQAGQDAVRRRINTITSPANSEYTIKMKGSSKPLIDTGQLLGSINYEVKV